MKKPIKSSGASVKLAGSAKAAPVQTPLNTLNPNDTAEVTIRLRRKKELGAKLEKGDRMTRAEYASVHGASDEDIDLVEQFATENHLSIVTTDKGRRSVIVVGKIGDLEKAFGVHLTDYKDAEGGSFRGRSGEICIPAALEGVVTGVFGLDDRPHARPHFQVVVEPNGVFAAHTKPAAFAPNALSAIYGFPTGVTGKGECIAIIELGGGFRNADLSTYFAGLGIPLPSVKAVSVGGASNHPTTANGADGEVMLDIEVAGAVAPGASIVVYFAKNTDAGFLNAITQAIHDDKNKPSVVSISWGAAEIDWTDQSLTSFNEAFEAAAVLGVTICVAAGDQGSDDAVGDGKVHVDFPASSPWVLACGGTKLLVNGKKVSSETVWHESDDSATGGGVSNFFALPDYQKTAKVPLAIDTNFKGRGVPDVAGNADPETGYKVRVDGQDLVIGGTSAVAPLMAGFIALMNEKNKKAAGFINTTIYKTKGVARDITKGDNITTSTKKGYKAGKGWDACTGLGVLHKL